ncbi:MAG: hypothetical protein M1828_001353 [Chrysothrix sp. TS-e1954]|nr:MAG: hypothetical protein M1828_001353 [Chrysothrix sp. TS-e1954]
MATKAEQKKMVKIFRDKYRKSALFTYTMRQVQAKFAETPPLSPAQAKEISLANSVVEASDATASSVTAAFLEAVNTLRPKSKDIQLTTDLTSSNVSLEWLRTGGAKSKVKAAGPCDCTILYVYGGAFYIGGPGMARPLTMNLAKYSEARIVVPTYRLAPQHPFPAGLLDLLVAYIGLIHPPPGAGHAACPARSIVLAGESAGGNLSLALIQTILFLRRKAAAQGRKPTVRWHGKDIELELPGGAATVSGLNDLSDCLPSHLSNGETDFLTARPGACCPDAPADDLWPTKPPRSEPYCGAAWYLHPLVNPLVAVDWTDSPPLWFAAGGGERLLDSTKIVAGRAASQGVPVIYEEYEGLPHMFVMMFPKLPQSPYCYKSWAKACRKMATGEHSETKGYFIEMPRCKTSEIDVKALAFWRQDEVLKRVDRAARERAPWTGPVIGPAAVRASL